MSLAIKITAAMFLLAGIGIVLLHQDAFMERWPVVTPISEINSSACALIESVFKNASYFSGDYNALCKHIVVYLIGVSQSHGPTHSQDKVSPSYG